MRAAVFHDQRDLRVDDLPEPETGLGSVKIKVGWCGICGSDLHEYLAGPIFVPPSGSPHPLTGEEIPVVLGHEFGGRVVEVGEGVSRVEAGDRVAVEPVWYCGECPECLRGAYNLCRKLGFYGLSGGGGGFSEFAVVPEYMAHRLPDELSDEESALVEPVAVGLHAVRQAGFTPGQSAIVFGAGPIGATTVQCLRASGASLVAVAEVAEARKDMARKIGADMVILVTKRISLSNVVEEGFEELVANRDRHVKILVQP